MSYSILGNKKVIKVNGKYMFLFNTASNNLTQYNPMTGRECLVYGWWPAVDSETGTFLFDTVEAIQFLENNVSNWDLAKSRRNFFEQGEVANSLQKAMLSKHGLEFDEMAAFKANEMIFKWQTEDGEKFFETASSSQELEAIQKIMHGQKIYIMDVDFYGEPIFKAKKSTGYIVSLGQGEYIKSISKTRIRIARLAGEAHLYQSKTSAQKAMARVIGARPWFENKCSLIEIK